MGHCLKARRLDPRGLLSLPVQRPLSLPTTALSFPPLHQLAQARPIGTVGKGWAGPLGSTQATRHCANHVRPTKARLSFRKDLLGGGCFCGLWHDFPALREGSA